MFVHKLGFLLSMLIVVEAELWTVPTAIDIQAGLEACQIENQLLLDKPIDEITDIRCLAKELDLWSDDEGFRTKHFVKLLSKYQQPLEISIVIDFCNKSHKQADPSKWADEAFKCFARGRMGLWINEFIKNVYKTKINQ